MAKASNTGFDPSIVARFFATLTELSADIKELRVEMQDIRKELARGHGIFAVHTEKLDSFSRWQVHKELECERHQKETQFVANELATLRATGAGMSLAWKIIVGAATLLSVTAGLLTMLKH